MWKVRDYNTIVTATHRANLQMESDFGSYKINVMDPRKEYFFFKIDTIYLSFFILLVLLENLLERNLTSRGSCSPELEG